MNKQQLKETILSKRSFLCVGLDTDIDKIPPHLLQYADPQFEFNKEIFDATKQFAPVYKINIAFYEALGVKGWQSLQKTVDYIRKTESNIFLIADAKRGDIGNTSHQYAKAFFDKKLSGLDFDALTVAPYMGIDSVSPFLQYKDKWVILLALTSNQGASDFQMLQTAGDKKHIFEHVIETSSTWADENSMMYVVGATKADMLKQIRTYIPNHFLLIPGVGAQGGSLEDVVRFGINSDVGLLINASRSIIFASKGMDFAELASQEASAIQHQMKTYLEEYSFI